MHVKQFTSHKLFLAVLTILLSIALIGAAPAAPFPEVIPLPNGFQPEGIASGAGTTFFVGSIPTGAVYRGDFATGTGELLVPAQSGRNAIGMKYDPRTGFLFVAGGPSGQAFIYDGETGANITEIPLASAPVFINDVVITREAAYFTNSQQPMLYRVPLLEDGSVPIPAVSEVIPFTGDYVFTPGAFNANGIEAAPSGQALLIVNSVDGALYHVDPLTGHATRIDLDGGSIPNGDGILLLGKDLYVVQNRLNQIAVIALAPDLLSGEIVETLTNPNFRVPTTITAFGDALYAVNARFGTPPLPDTDYEVVRVPRH